MEFIKNNIKTIISIIVTAIIFTGFSVYATTTYLAKDVSYIKNDGTQINVEDALNELYNNYNNNHIEKGQITKTLPTSWKYETISFENEYTEIPEVYYLYNAGKSGGSVYIEEITTKSFKIGYTNFFARDRIDTIEWIAIGK